jgi:uncharacterized iron-regulated protein
LRSRRGGAAVLAALLVAACSSPSAQSEKLVFAQPVVLLGEVHDNAAQHALRLRAFEDWLARGARPALLMEQFDRERQGDIDRLRAQRPPPDADALIAAATAPRDGWNWAFYKPFVALALQYGLPIVAANVSRDDARGVIRDGLAARGFDAAVPADIESAIVQEVLDSHCGMLDEPTARRMTRAQVARDQFMARTVEAHAERGVVLLAGNGHVRSDIGVPRWLSADTRSRSEAIGVLESRDRADGRFDRVVFTAAQPREDPCAAMRRAPAAASGASSGLR